MMPELSARRSRLAMLFFMCLMTFTCCGFIFGFQAVANALRNNGEFASLCEGKPVPCNAQTLHWNEMYVIAVCVTFAVFGLYGYCLDQVGPRLASSIGFVFIALGVLLIALSNSRTMDAYAPGLIFIGAGSAGPYLSAFHTCQLFNVDARGATSILVGCMIGSSLLSLIFAEIIAVGVSHHIVFGAHFIWVLFMATINYNLQPSDSIFTTKTDIHFLTPFTLRYEIVTRNPDTKEHVEKDANDQVSVIVESPEIDEEKDKENASPQRVYQLVGTLVFLDEVEPPIPSTTDKSSRYNSLWDVCKSPAFWIMMAFLNIHMLRFNFFIATALTKIDSNGGGNLYVSLLFILVPLLGFISNVFLVPEVMKRFGIGGVLWFAQILGLGYGVLVLIPGKTVQLGLFVLFSMHRSFLFSFMYPYMTAIFGLKLFGTVNGVLLTISGLFSLLQYPLITIAEEVYDGNYFPVDLVVFVILAAVLLFFPIALLSYIPT